jgi:predicted O-methyltransferase YrrM
MDITVEMSKKYLEFEEAISNLAIRCGSINYTQQGFLIDFLQTNTHIKNILETGFNLGYSSATMMEARPDIRIVSSDIFWFDYTRKAKLLLDIAYPGRHTLLAGNSVNTLPTFFTQFDYMPDFVFIDGGHESPVPYIDLYNILKHVKPGTPVMVDDYCLEHGKDVIVAVNRFINLGVLSDVQFYKDDDRGWVLALRSPLPMPPSDYDLSAESVDKLLRDTVCHYDITQSFDETVATPLCEIMGRNKSDKGHTNITTSWHNYTTYYYSIFNEMRNKKLRVFELGLGTNNVNLESNMGADGRPGASLYGWAEFFPNSEIFGADIDKDILFKEDRISTFYCDQTNPEIIKEMWSNSALEEAFDIIVEDGLHTYEANVCFFENSIHKLSPGGYYIIEDILMTDIEKFRSKIVEWKKTYNCEFTLLKIPSLRNNVDNNLLVVRNLNKIHDI